MATDFRELGNALDAARNKGASAAEILYESSTGHSAEVHRSRVLRNTPTQHQRLVARAWLDGGKYGEASAEGVEATAATLDGLWDEALALAGKAKADPHSGPWGRLAGSPRGLGLEDRRYDGLTPEMRLDVVLDAERGARDVDRSVLTDPFRYEDKRVHRVFLDTKGTAIEEAGTVYECSGAVRVSADGQELRLAGGTQGRTFASISSLPFGVQLSRRAIALLGAGPTVNGPVRVLLPPLAVAQIIERIAPAFTAAAIADGQNFLAGHTLDDRIHLLDDGSLPGALRTTAFDDRGIGPVPLTLIRDGQLSGRFLSSREARRHETRPTGHLSHGALIPRNLAMRPGTRSMNAILSDLGDTVYVVDHFVDLDGLDIVTGELSALTHGELKVGTEAKGPVRSVRLRGNLREVFRAVVELASDTDRHGYIDAPGIVVDGFTAE